MYNTLYFIILKGKITLCTTFYYKSYIFNKKTGILHLNYHMAGRDFCEKIAFPLPKAPLSTKQEKALDSIFFLTHIAAGISYYKAYCPPEIIIESGILSEKQATFFNTFYVCGLGEFAIKNKLNLQGKINFPYDKNHNPSPVFIDFLEQSLVPIGGGKDSCVSIELLKGIQHEIATIAVGNPVPIENCAKIANTRHLTIKRTLDSALIDLNNTQNVYNGHIPITGVLAFLLWAQSVMETSKYVAMSCESSANVGNLMQGDLQINHQYSKSLDFEADFHHLTSDITPDFRYYSLLRPFNELMIGALFANICQQYTPVFTSCNKAFKLDETARIKHWCGNCDKCRFVFLILAPFMDKQTLISAIGHNLLDNIDNLAGYQELLGLAGHKPFECVGEVDECQSAFYALTQSKNWQNDAIIKALAPKIAPQKLLLKKHEENHVPHHILEKIRKKYAHQL